MRMKLKVPEKCDECAYIRPWYHGKFICSAVSFDDPQVDISTTYVDPASKPDWCPIDKPNEKKESKHG